MPTVTLIDVLTKKTTAPVGTYVPNPPPVVTPPSTPPSSGGGGGGGSSGGSTQPTQTNDTGLTQEQLDKAKNILTGGGLQVTTFPLPEATITVSPDVMKPNYTYGTGTPEQVKGGIPSQDMDVRSKYIDRMIAEGNTPEKAIYGLNPTQTIDLSNAPSNVQDLASKGWIITSETKTSRQSDALTTLNFLRTGQLQRPSETTVTNYYARRPTTEETFEYVYGTGRTDVLTSSAFSKSFMGLGTLGSGIQQLITGDKNVGVSEKEELMRHALYSQELRSRYGDLPGLVASIGTSPAVQETVLWAGMEVGAPVLFSGAGALISKGGSRLATIGAKITTGLERLEETLGPTGKTILSTARETGSALKTLVGETSKPIIEIGKETGRIIGTRPGQAAVISTMYLGMEGPGLIETARNRPERLGSQLTESLGLWGAMSTSLIRGSKEFVIERGPGPKTDVLGVDFGGFQRELVTTKKNDNIIQQFIGRMQEVKAGKPTASERFYESYQTMKGAVESRMPGIKSTREQIFDFQNIKNMEIPKEKIPRTTQTTLYQTKTKYDYFGEDIRGKDYYKTTTTFTTGTKESGLLKYPAEGKNLLGTKKYNVNYEFIAPENKPLSIAETQRLYEQHLKEIDLLKTKAKAIRSPEQTRLLEVGKDYVIFGNAEPTPTKFEFRSTGFKEPKNKPMTLKDIYTKMSEEAKTEMLKPKTKKTTSYLQTEDTIPSKKLFMDVEGNKITISRLEKGEPLTKKSTPYQFNKENWNKVLEGKEKLDTAKAIESSGKEGRYVNIKSNKYENLYYHEPEIETVNRPLTRQERSILGDIGRDEYIRSPQIKGMKLGRLGGLAIGTRSILEPKKDILSGRGMIDVSKKYTDIFTETKIGQDFFTETESDTDTITDTYRGTIPLITSKTDLQQGTIQQARQQTTMLTDTLRIPSTDYTRRTRTTIPPRTDERTTTKPRPPFIPGLPGNEDETEKQTSRKTREQLGFIPEVHERGRWIPLTKKTLSRREALNFLAETLDESKAAVGRLQPSKGKLQTLGIQMKDYSSISRKFKEKDNLIIEKREYRIDSPGEKKQITAKGHVANRLKGIRTRSGLSNTDYFGKTNNIKISTKIRRTNRRNRYV